MATPDGGGDGRRYPENMQGLLQFCVSNTAEEDASGPPAEMDSERRQFLNEAIAAMEENDLVKQLTRCLDILNEGSTEDKMESLESLQEICEDLDLAKDFHKVGGFAVLPKLMKDENPEVRAGVCSLIGTLVQNNPYCQQEALKADFLPQLLLLLDTDCTESVKTKALYAVSCLTRDVESAQDIFVEKDGFSVLLRSMQTGIEKVQIKAAFMIKAMCVSKPQFKDTLRNMGMVLQLIHLLQQEHTHAHEHLMAALLNLVQDSKQAMQDCLRPELGFSDFLSSHKELLTGKEEFMEEMEHTQALQEILLKATNNLNAAVDR